MEPAGQPGRPLVLTGAQVWTGDGECRPAAVLVEGDRIRALDRRVPGDAAVVDLAGATLLPGFIDAHVHAGFTTAAAILAGGVTTVRDLGSPPAVRRRYAGSPLTVRWAGRMLTPVGGYPTESWGDDGTAREVGDAADALAAVREQADAGAAIVKVACENSRGRPLFDAEVLGAVVTAAHDAGLRVTAHVGTAEALALALRSGVDELAHLPLYDVTAQEMAEVAAAGLALVPTMAIRGGHRSATAALRAFLEAGGRVLYGTDLGNAGIGPGIMPAEIAALLDAGMTPAAVVAAATSDAADYLGLDAIGRIRPGTRADLVAVAGDPLADPRAYRRVRLVVAGGRVVTSG